MAELLNYTDIQGESGGSLAGRSAILMHGMFGSLSNLASLGRALAAQGCRVVAADMPNHGESPHSSVMNYASMAADIIALADHLELANPFLVGHSMGGKTAMQAALSYPQRLAGIAVLDISPVAYEPRHDPVIAGLTELTGALKNGSVNSRTEASSLLEAFVPDTMTRAFLLKNLYRNSAGEWRLKLNLEALSANYYSGLAAAVSGQPYLGPALLLKGETSAYIQSKHRPFIDQLLPHVELQIVSAAGHWLHAEQPAVVENAVVEFISRHSGV